MSKDGIDWGPEFWVEIEYRDENHYAKIKDYFHTRRITVHMYDPDRKDKREKTIIITPNSITEKFWGNFY